MYNYSRMFFSSKHAEAFAKKLNAQKIKTVIVTERDYLNAGGTLYYVMWN